MKRNFLIIMMFLFIGCSSIYKVSNFPSKEKFYEDFNKSVKNKFVKVTLRNDSAFNLQTGIMVSNDSLILIKQIISEQKIKKNNIKNIKYFYDNMDISNYTIKIFLNDGSIVNAKNGEIFNDSLYIFNIIKEQKEYLTIREVKEVSYKSNWLGVPFGFGTGLGLGMVATKIESGLSYQGSIPSWFIVVPITSIIAGSILGWFEGYNYTYQFNP